MGYYIYENWTADKKAVIHMDNCTFCNYGNGTGRNKLGKRNGKWHGPFSGLEEANEKATSFRDRDLRNCSFCIK